MGLIESAKEALQKLLDKEAEEKRIFESLEEIEFHGGLVISNDIGQRYLIQSLLSKNKNKVITEHLSDLLLSGSNYDCWSYLLNVASEYEFAEYIIKEGLYPKGVSIATDYHSFPEIKSKKPYEGGVCFEFDENGNIEFFYLMKNGKLDGNCFQFYESGEIKEISSYKKGKQNGAFTSFHRNGLIKDIRFYTDDVLRGKNITYYESGNIKDICNFVNGNLKGEFVKYNRDGTIEKIENFD
jgi:antitoxin component YwqK of YwqJK toxin-antitoxin module